MTTLDVEAAVRERYSGTSTACETELCCPVDYDPSLLALEHLQTKSINYRLTTRPTDGCC
jgi:hypothetical protein